MSIIPVTLYYLTLTILIAVWYFHVGSNRWKLDTKERQEVGRSLKRSLGESLEREGFGRYFVRDSEAPETTPGEIFVPPKWYIIAFRARAFFIILVMVLLFAPLGVAMFFGQDWIRIYLANNLSRSPDSIIFVNFVPTLLAAFLQLLCIGMMFVAIIQELLFLLFPRLRTFSAWFDVAMKRVRSLAKPLRPLNSETLKKLVTREEMAFMAKSSMKMFLAVVLSIFVFMGPLFVLAVDTYTIVDDRGIATNRFIGFGETLQDWQEVDRIAISWDVYSDGKGKRNLNLIFGVLFKDGSTLDLNGDRWGSYDSLSQVIILSLKHGVDVEYEEPVGEELRLMEKYIWYPSFAAFASSTILK